MTLGDLVVCGIPCADFSPMGMRQELSGPSGALICTWVRVILEFLPTVLLVEEVPGFKRHGLPFISSDDALGLHYSFDHVLLDPRHLGLPVSRPRLYCVACLRSSGGSPTLVECHDRRAPAFRTRGLVGSGLLLPAGDGGHFDKGSEHPVAQLC